MTTSSQPDPILARFRKSIDNIDAALIHMLAERFRITQSVGEYKAKVTLPPADPAREQEHTRDVWWVRRITGYGYRREHRRECSERERQLNAHNPQRRTHGRTNATHATQYTLYL